MELMLAKWWYRNKMVVFRQAFCQSGITLLRIAKVKTMTIIIIIVVQTAAAHYFSWSRWMRREAAEEDKQKMAVEFSAMRTKIMNFQASMPNHVIPPILLYTVAFRANGAMLILCKIMPWFLDFAYTEFISRVQNLTPSLCLSFTLACSFLSFSCDKSLKWFMFWSNKFACNKPFHYFIDSLFRCKTTN